MAIGVAPKRVLLLGSVDSATGTYTYVTSGTSTPQDLAAFSKWSVFVQSDGGTIAGGVLTIEEADYDPSLGPGYGGAWSSITTVTLTGLSAAIGQSAYHSSEASYAFVRVRLSTTVSGGGKVIVSMRARE